MSQRWVLVGVVALLAIVAATVAVTSAPGAQGSALSPAPAGLLVARRYLEESGTPVKLLDQAADAQTASGVLVVAFPWQRLRPGDDLGALRALVQDGVTLVYGFSGSRYAPMESEFLEAIGLVRSSPRGQPPLHPARWRAFASETWRLLPEAFLRAEPLETPAPFEVPRAPEDATVLFRGPGDAALVFTYPVGAGRVVVLPAAALSNAWLPRGGNLALLEHLRVRFPGPWTFDEFHHGLSAPESGVQAGSRRALDLYLLQLLLLYALALLALARRFGPAWSDPPILSGSAGAFLLSLGQLHHRLDHARAAAPILIARARELQPHLPALAAAGGDGELLPLARTLSRHQRSPRRTR